MIIEAIYFTGTDCGVCQVLKPKLKAMLAKNFPEVKFSEVNIQNQPELAAQNMIFTIPVLLIQVDGREYAKFIRSFSLQEVKDKLQRVYSML